jgi:hypothetical protein
MGILQLISSSSFIAVNKLLMKELGLHEAVILGELASEYNYYEQEGKLTSDGSFYSTIENLEDKTTLSRYQQKNALDNLQEAGLIEVSVQGIPAKRFIKLFPDAITDKFVNNSQTSNKETNKLSCKKLTSNNNINNKNNINNNINNNFTQKPNPEPKSSSSIVKPKKSKKDKSIEKIIAKFEEYDFTENVKDKILDFYEDQIEKKSYPADNQLTMMLDELSHYSETEILDAINNSIRSGYKGIFPKHEGQKTFGKIPEYKTQVRKSKPKPQCKQSFEF